MSEENKLKVSDIEEKLQSRIDYLERNGVEVPLRELLRFQDWLLNGSKYNS